MNTLPLKILRLAVLSVWVIALSGCALGGRVKSIRMQEQPQQQQNQSAVPFTTSTQTSAPAAIESAVPAVEAGSPGDSSDAQADELLNLIDSLAAANHAGDAFDDLP